ncbi:TIGR03773 family transporter-associated surface protein [Austwickia chelonae]|nr:TIGR03773 family transporter-associated surface protein [Austwickia chelonae]
MTGARGGRGAVAAVHGRSRLSMVLAGCCGVVLAFPAGLAPYAAAAEATPSAPGASAGASSSTSKPAAPVPSSAAPSAPARTAAPVKPTAAPKPAAPAKPTGAALTGAGSGAGTSAAAPAAPAAVPTSAASSPDSEAEEATTATAAPAGKKIDQGDVDVFDVMVKDGVLQLGSATGSGAQRVSHDPGKVVFHVKPQAHRTGLPEAVVKGGAGYLLPEKSTSGLLRPSWNAAQAQAAGFTEVDLKFTMGKNPGGVALYTGGSSPQRVLAEGYALPGTLQVGKTGRGVANWVFTKAGTYTMTVQASAVKDGKKVTSRAVTYTWVVEAPASTPPATTPPGTPNPPATSNPVPSPSNPVTSAPGRPSTPVQGKVTLNRGVADLFYVRKGQGALDLAVREHITGRGVVRTPEDVRILVGDNALRQVPPGFPEAGTRAYVLPASGDQKLIQLGWNTSALEGTGLGATDIEMSVSGPGRVSLFRTNSERKPVSVLTHRGMALPGTFHLSKPALEHANWLFSAPGTYTLTARATSSGMSSRTATYTFVVGGSAGASTAPSARGGARGEAPVGPLPDALPVNTPGGWGGWAAPLPPLGNDLGLPPIVTPIGEPPQPGEPVEVDPTPILDGVCSKPGATGMPSGVATSGNFDITQRLDAQALLPMIKDSRNAQPKLVSPTSMVFGLGDKARHKAPEGMEFIAKSGENVWTMGATPEEGVPLIGENSQHESLMKEAAGPVTVTLTAAQGPGQVAHFLPGPFGGGVGQRLFDTVGGTTSYALPLNARQVGSWVFTKPGEYRLTLTHSVKTKQGKELAAPMTLNVVVGGCNTGPKITAPPKAAVSQQTAAPNPSQVAASRAGFGVKDGLLAAALAVNAGLLYLLARRHRSRKAEAAPGGDTTGTV